MLNCAAMRLRTKKALQAGLQGFFLANLATAERTAGLAARPSDGVGRQLALDLGTLQAVLRVLPVGHIGHALQLDV